MAEMRVVVEGGYNATTGAVVSPLPVALSGGAGSSTVTIANGAGTAYSSASANSVVSLQTAGGMPAAQSTMSGQTANGPGGSVSAGFAQSNWCAIAVATGSPTAGTLTIELSHDGTNWASSSATVSITAAGNYLVASTGRPARFARCNLTGLAGTINLTVNLAAGG